MTIWLFCINVGTGKAQPWRVALRKTSLKVVM